MGRKRDGWMKEKEWVEEKEWMGVEKVLFPSTFE